MSRPPASGYRWRRLTPTQRDAARLAYRSGCSVPALAAEYGVSRSAMYRALRPPRLPVHVVTVASWQATFEVTDEGPVRLTPWFPRPDAA